MNKTEKAIDGFSKIEDQLDSNIGVAGSITDSDFMQVYEGKSIADVITKEWNDHLRLNDRYRSGYESARRTTPNGYLYDSATDVVYDPNWLSWKVWSQYAAAMSRRRDTLSPFHNIVGHIYKGYVTGDATFKLFSYKDSFILGRFRGNIFTPSHFAPKTLREGIETLRALFRFDNIIVLPTEDLVPMLEKLGLYYAKGLDIPMNFRGTTVNKKLFTTNKNLDPRRYDTFTMLLAAGYIDKYKLNIDPNSLIKESFTRRRQKTLNPYTYSLKYTERLQSLYESVLSKISQTIIG